MSVNWNLMNFLGLVDMYECISDFVFFYMLYPDVFIFV